MNLQKATPLNLLRGQASVLRVASELMYRGLNVSFPQVDAGVDLWVENSVRLQVKSSGLFCRPPYPNGFYHFKFEKQSIVRNYNEIVHRPSQQFSDRVDFVVLYGVNEQRAWIVPAVKFDGKRSVYVGPKLAWTATDLAELKRLRSAGMTYQEIGEATGITASSVKHRLRNNSTMQKSDLRREVEQYEDRWDLITGALSTLTEANQIAQTPRVSDHSTVVRP